MPLLMRFAARLMALAIGVLLATACVSKAGTTDPAPQPTIQKLQVLYFMSFHCRGCREVNPLIDELYQRGDNRLAFTVLAYGTLPDQLAAARAAANVSFPVTAGSTDQADRYEVHGTPTVVVLDASGETKEHYQGVRAVRRFLQAVDSGGLWQETGILELTRHPERFDGREVSVRGLLWNRGADVFNAAYVISNGRDELGVAAPLPAEVAPRPPGAARTRPPVMSDLLNQEVVLHGKVKLIDGKPLLETMNWQVSP